MFADNKESIIEKSVDKSYSVVMPNTYYDGEKFCILGEKYGPFVLTSDPNNTRSKAEMKKLKDSVKRFLTIIIYSEQIIEYLLVVIINTLI